MTQLRPDRSRDADRSLACPRDGRAMDRVSRDGVTMLRCGACHGHWFDEDAVRRASSADEHAGLLSRVAVGPAAADVSACPRCAAPIAGAWLGDVRVEACTACHGVWVTSQELAEAKRAGGVGGQARFGAFLAAL